MRCYIDNYGEYYFKVNTFFFLISLLDDNVKCERGGESRGRATGIYFPAVGRERSVQVRRHVGPNIANYYRVTTTRPATSSERIEANFPPRIRVVPSRTRVFYANCARRRHGGSLIYCFITRTGDFGKAKNMSFIFIPFALRAR